MTYVYILQSTANPDRHYVGYTADLRARLQKHNAGEVSHISKYSPWTIRTYIVFTEKERACAIEKYLKSGSGRAFTKNIFDGQGEPKQLPTNIFRCELGVPTVC